MLSGPKESFFEPSATISKNYVNADWEDYLLIFVIVYKKQIDLSL